MKSLYCLILLLFIACLPLFSDELESERRIYAFLSVRDSFGASQEAALALKQYPQSTKLWEAYIKALAQRGDELALLKAWEEYQKLNPQSLPKSDVIENVSWGVIKAGSENPSPLIRLMAIIAAYFGNDARGVEIIRRSLIDMHAGIRDAAAEVAGKMRDTSLCETVFAQLKTEKDVQVQLSLIKAVGGMGIVEAKPYLLYLISQPTTRAEHRAAAIASLLNLMKEIDQVQLLKCVKSDRAGLRLLACECIAYLGLARDFDLALGLAGDTNQDVRVAALQTLGLLSINEEQKKRVINVAEAHVNAPDPGSAISAAWLLTLKDPQRGQQYLKPWLEHESQEVRLQAAAALAGTGRYGRPLLEQTFKATKDSFVKINLAMGLISLRIDSQAGCEALKQAMDNDKGRWMREDFGILTYIAPSREYHKNGIANYPETVNQLLRLELINTMAMLRYPGAQEAVQSFLGERAWGVTGLASALLLTEGDEEAVKIVERLLNDPHQKVRAQAALMLGLWGGDDAALNALVEAYSSGHREMKEQILEAMGNIHSTLVVPFLVERLQEPSQTLRLIAAASLLRALN